MIFIKIYKIITRCIINRNFISAWIDSIIDPIIWIKFIRKRIEEMIRASKGSDIIIRALYSSANCGPNSRGSKNAYILVETHWILRGVREACMWNTRESEWVSERKREIGDSFLSSSQRIFLSKLEKLVITVSVSISFFFFRGMRNDFCAI